MAINPIELINKSFLNFICSSSLVVVHLVTKTATAQVEILSICQIKYIFIGHGHDRVLMLSNVPFH